MVRGIQQPDRISMSRCDRHVARIWSVRWGKPKELVQLIPIWSVDKFPPLLSFRNSLYASRYAAQQIYTNIPLFQLQTFQATYSRFPHPPLVNDTTLFIPVCFLPRTVGLYWLAHLDFPRIIQKICCRPNTNSDQQTNKQTEYRMASVSPCCPILLLLDCDL